MGAEDRVEDLSEVLQAVKAIGDLRSLRRARAGTVDIGFEAISGDHRHTGMRT